MVAAAHACSLNPYSLSIVRHGTAPMLRPDSTRVPACSCHLTQHDAREAVNQVNTEVRCLWPFFHALSATGAHLVISAWTAIRLNAEVRMPITEIPIGVQGIALDRTELDAWVDQYIACNGRHGREKGNRYGTQKRRRVSSNVAVSGTSTNASADGEFVKALTRQPRRGRTVPSATRLKESGKQESME